MARETPDGAFVEVGVWKGGTAWHLADLADVQGRWIWLYDTFTGMPYAQPIDVHPIGDFGDTSWEGVCAAIPWIPSDHIVKGIFPHSFIKPADGIAFAHLDCDQYQSVHEAIAALVPHMVKDGVMWFDDAPCLSGARLAVEGAFPMQRLELSGRGKYFVRF